MLGVCIMDLTSKSITFHQSFVIARSGKGNDKSRSATLSIAYHMLFLFSMNFPLLYLLQYVRILDLFILRKE